MNLYLDMDNTIFDFTSQYLKYHHKETGYKKYLENGECYNFFQTLGISENEKYRYLTLEGFFENMEPFEDAVEVINDMNTHLKVYFVSTAVVPEAFMGKVKSLQKLFSWFDFEKHLIIMKDKHLLSSGLIIDDNPEVLQKSYGHHITIAFDQDWNRGIKSNYRISKWKELYAIVYEVLNQEVEAQIETNN